ncbi:MAG: nitronate monooxygenase [Marinilabiliales bacterium]|nr:MAG: nitronate monooxygenase [Marinilabiliales bacterium]
MNPLKIGDLSIPIPIVQGGMGIGISLATLASTVANQGGIGVISTVGLGSIYKFPGLNFKENALEAIRNEIRKARKLTKGILGVNIMTVLTNFDEIVKTVIEEKIDIIFAGAGLPLNLPAFLNSSSITKLVPIISSSRAAKIIAKKWKTTYNYLPDAFVVEGPKAGGHLGFKEENIKDTNYSLETLVKETSIVTDELYENFQKNIPIIAGGGITSGEEMFTLMQNGASEIQLGSRFVATEECDASIEFKKAIVALKENDICIIKSPVGLPGRAIKNSFLEEIEKGNKIPTKCKFHCIKTCNPKETQFCIAEALISAYKGNLNNGFVFCGANAFKINSIITVKDVFQEFITSYNIKETEKLEGL